MVKAKTKEDKIEDTNPDTITLPKDQLENLIKQMEEMKKTNSMLLEVADKKALSRFYSNNKTELPSIIRLRTIDGKVVVGWRSISNAVRQNPLTGVWNEDQRTELIFEDGTRKEMQMLEFESEKVMINTTRIGEIRNEETKQLALKLRRTDNGQELVISVEFVN
jgi:hypothetical protein